jgi:hypothetical protein
VWRVAEEQTQGFLRGCDSRVLAMSRPGPSRSAIVLARPPIVGVALDVLETPFSVWARRYETRQAAAAAGTTIRLPTWSKGEAGT